jgi:hypothetical protein
MLRDLKNPAMIYVKGGLFFLGGVLAALGLMAEQPTLKTAILVGALIWCAARCYYFMFYVIEHYVDDTYRFSGILAFLKYLLTHKRHQPQSSQPVNHANRHE